MTDMGWAFSLAWMAVVIAAYWFIVFRSKSKDDGHKFVMVYGGGFMAGTIYWAGFILIAFLNQNP